MKWSNRTENNELAILLLLNISAMCFFLFILMGVLLPLIVWVLTRERSLKIDEVGKKVLNFQISFCLLTGYLFAMMIIGPTLHLSYSTNAEFTFMFIALIYAINFFFIVFNSIRCYLGLDVIYPALWLIR